jgi:hypothetical protein
MAGQDPAIQKTVTALLDGRLLAAHGETLEMAVILSESR